MSSFTALRKWLQLKQYHFELSLSIYMMTPGEKFTFCMCSPESALFVCVY